MVNDYVISSFERFWVYFNLWFGMEITCNDKLNVMLLMFSSVETFVHVCCSYKVYIVSVVIVVSNNFIYIQYFGKNSWVAKCYITYRVQLEWPIFMLNEVFVLYIFWTTMLYNKVINQTDNQIVLCIQYMKE